MAFYLPRQAHTWFKNIRKEMKLDFDVYNLCLLVGLKKGKTYDFPSKDIRELVDNFPGNYARHRSETIALFLSMEIKKRGLESADKLQINELIDLMISPDSPSKLTPEGQKQFNRYCYGGWRMIYERFGEAKPHHLDQFLADLAEMLEI
jgi:hypothetical protein